MRSSRDCNSKSTCKDKSCSLWTEWSNDSECQVECPRAINQLRLEQKGAPGCVDGLVMEERACNLGACKGEIMVNNCLAMTRAIKQ